MKNINLYSMYVSRPVRMLVYLFGLFIIIYTYRLIDAINQTTHRIESSISRIEDISNPSNNLQLDKTEK